MLPGAWPPYLTNASWQKKKGNIAKIVSETGIGAALDEAEAAWKHIDWHQVEHKVREVLAMPAEHREHAFEQYYQKSIAPMVLKLRKVNTASKTTVAKWKSNKLIPDSSRKAAEEVGRDAAEFAKHFDGSAKIFVHFNNNVINR